MSVFVLDANTICRTIKLLHPDGELFEIRLINGSYNASGYFTSAFRAIRALQSFQAGWNKEGEARHSNIFITLNPVNPACYSRRQHDMLVEKVKPTTNDTEIIAFHWFLIDLDPKRISGVSSSNEELQLAFTKAKEIHDFLESKGWKAPIQAMSGNGCHLVYRFDEPNTPENIDLCEKALKALQAKFGDDTIDIDITVFNPSRICKLWGTIAQKGTNTPERPHRKAYIMDSTPEYIEINDKSCLEKLVAELLPLADEQQSQNIANTDQSNNQIPQKSDTQEKKTKSNFNLLDFINKHQIPIRNTETTPDGSTMYVLEHCLFDESHGNKDAAIIQKADGTICYHCFHAHCADKHWKDVRSMYEPNAYDEKPSKKKPASPYDIDGTGTLTIANLKHYMKQKGYTVKYDIIKHELTYTGFKGQSKEHLAENAPALMSDELQFHLKKGSTGNVAEKLLIIGTEDENKVNPILERIQNTAWDGIDRIAEIYDIFGIDESDTLSRTLIKKWLMQCICGLFNNFENPFSLDIVLVFQGGQGIGKTRFFEHIALNQKYFNGGACIDPRDKDSVMQATSAWICELGELGSTMKKDMDSVKAFFTKSMDEYRAPYGRTTLKYPRITSFVGTVNDEQFLIDQTGNRRFATVSIRPDIEIDYDTQVAPFNALQLWAQIYSIVQSDIDSGATLSGCFRLTNDEKKALDIRNSSFTKPMKGELEVLDILTSLILEKTDNKYGVEKRWMTTTEFRDSHISLARYTTVQIGKILEKYGYPLQIRKITKADGTKITARLRFLPVKFYVGNSNNE